MVAQLEIKTTAAYPGPVLLVGQYYGGVVIGDKPGNDPNVAGLVYVAAFAPDSGESALSLLLEEWLAERMIAATITLPTCHLAMLQEPLRVAEFIVQAATLLRGQ
jgi:hypothetical protein